MSFRGLFNRPARSRRPALRRLVALAFASALTPAAAHEAALLGLLKEPGHVLLVRHAHAPGFGDPAGFRVGDCSTQRNLDDRGRTEARAVGKRLRAAGISRARVLSSEWCRCTDTARLLGLGEVETAPALNSFFERPDEGPARLAATRRLIADSTRDALPVVMVTHHVTIAGITGRNVGTAEGVVVRSTADGPRLVGAITLTR